MCYCTSEFSSFLRKTWEGPVLERMPTSALEMTNPEIFFNSSSNRWHIAQPTLGDAIYLAYISGFFMNLDSSHF